ncbi:MAG: hypothetical protein R3346_01965 [Candidatus Spechtbacterales bacterium]|nr:hypothetical protein [Candidatus Spechtbacterales bacterium]
MKKLQKVSAFLAIFALAAVLGAGSVSAHGTHSAAPLANGCLLRADVLANEASELTGKDAGVVGDHLGGNYIDLQETEVAGDHGLVCTYGMVKWVTNLLFFVLLAVATLVIAYAAFLFVSAGGNEEKVGKARKYLVLAIVALLVAAVARVIPAIVRGIVGL